MIVLDTNVLSELARIAPAAAVSAWMDAQIRSLIFITAVTKAELLYGIEILPAGRRRAALHQSAEQMFLNEFAGRILPFDSDAAEAYARIAASRRAMGRPISQADAQIAAIARSRGATLATRNIADFEHCGIKMLNPWTE
ncbi:MAG TPA: type II toxin-antitoxin system VapC family toxin [Bryobacteraceae bacterium]|nr:type II toxin-antitoxin system VapC family toxin [Bryobacteraceae bacterium]